MSKLEELISNVLNPVTGKSLVEEDRVIEFEMKADFLHFKYNREGIGPNEKKKLEVDILSALKKEVEEDKIFIFSTSESSSDVYKSFGVENDEKK